jgi:hypothetical protein
VDPDPDTDPKKIIPDPQHWLEISFWRGGGLRGGGLTNLLTDSTV